MHTRHTRLITGQKAALAAGTLGLVAAAGTGAAIASDDDDAGERPIVGQALARATEAALAETGGGEVTGTEVGDEESRYEVEVTLDDGSEVDVQLDEDFQVVGHEAEALPRGADPVDLDPADLTADIDHAYWPMAPGTRWTYREVDEEGHEQRVVVTVTAETREIANGVVARVVRDTVTQDGELVEDTFDWYAQDAEGTIWYLGEETAEFEDGELSSRAGSFEAGVDGALPGVILPGEPEVGLAYRQEYYEGEAEDNGQVLSVSEMAEVPAGQYHDVLLTRDTNALDPDVLEYKLYAPGVGPVLALGVSGGGGREELVETTRVDDATARAAGTTPLGEPYE